MALIGRLIGFILKIAAWAVGLLLLLGGIGFVADQRNNRYLVNQDFTD